MRFSTVASSVALFGAVAMALPNAGVVYQTEVVTITSCAPEVSNCPGTAIPEYGIETPAPEVPQPTGEYPTPEETPAPEYPVEETPIVEVPVEETPVEEKPVETPVGEYPVKETPVEESPVEPEYPIEETPVEETPVGEYPVKETPVEESPVEPEYPVIVPSGTGSYNVPANTSTPVIPTSPSDITYEGAASAKSFSLFAVIAAAGALLF